jgi:hypothetical protein
MNFLKPELNTGLPDISFNGGDLVVGQPFADQSVDALAAQGLRAADCFLSELHAGGQAELGVDVGEVRLHGSW